MNDFENALARIEIDGKQRVGDDNWGKLMGALRKEGGLTPAELRNVVLPHARCSPWRRTNSTHC